MLEHALAYLRLVFTLISHRSVTKKILTLKRFPLYFLWQIFICRITGSKRTSINGQYYQHHYNCTIFYFHYHCFTIPFLILSPLLSLYFLLIDKLFWKRNELNDHDWFCSVYWRGWKDYSYYQSRIGPWCFWDQACAVSALPNLSLLYRMSLG